MGSGSLPMSPGCRLNLAPGVLGSGGRIGRLVLGAAFRASLLPAAHRCAHDEYEQHNRYRDHDHDHSCAHSQDHLGHRLRVWDSLSRLRFRRMRRTARSPRTRAMRTTTRTAAMTMDSWNLAAARQGAGRSCPRS